MWFHRDPGVQWVTDRRYYTTDFIAIGCKYLDTPRVRADLQVRIDIGEDDRYRHRTVSSSLGKSSRLFAKGIGAICNRQLLRMSFAIVDATRIIPDVDRGNSAPAFPKYSLVAYGQFVCLGCIAGKLGNQEKREIPKLPGGKTLNCANSQRKPGLSQICAGPVTDSISLKKL